MTRQLTRRELAGLAGLTALSACVEAGDGREVLRRDGVVGVAGLEPPGQGRISPAVASDAVARALVAATGTASASEAVAGLFRSDDVVGIKLNCLGGPHLSPRVELVEALVGHLRAGGLGPEQVIVFERSGRELERAGFEVRRSGGAFLCHGIDNDYDRSPETSGAIGSCFATLVSTTCTALVGFGVVKDHDLAGVSASLKNWYGVIHNPNKYHDNNCDPYVADVLRHRFVGGKLRLTVLDGVTAQYHGGPAFRADTRFELGAVVASTDPVAADVWAWEQIDAERARRGLPSLEQAERPPRFLATAARYGLGVGERGTVREVRA